MIGPSPAPLHPAPAVAPPVPGPGATTRDAVAPFRPSWPAPAGPPSSRVLQATVLAGLATVVTLPAGDDDPGLGWLLAALAVAAAVVVVGWRPHRAIGAVLPRWVALAESLWLPAAVALAAVPLLRDADWLVVLCLLAAVGAGSLAVAGRAFRSVLRGATAVPVAALRSPAWLGRSATGLRRNGGGFRLLASLLVGLGLLAVFAPLLGSA
ncbi:MAG: DUF4153 domain-containing protein, partial [Pseudonocardia sediminis]